MYMYIHTYRAKLTLTSRAKDLRRCASEEVATRQVIRIPSNVKADLKRCDFRKDVDFNVVKPSD